MSFKGTADGESISAACFSTKRAISVGTTLYGGSSTGPCAWDLAAASVLRIQTKVAGTTKRCHQWQADLRETRPASAADGPLAMDRHYNSFFLGGTRR